MARLDAVVRDLRIERSVAVAVLAGAARDRLTSYITQVCNQAHYISHRAGGS